MGADASVSATPSVGTTLGSLTGLGLALLIVVGWLVSLVALLRGNLTAMPSSWIGVLTLCSQILMRTFLQTGLFIVTHDAMHGSLLPAVPRWNHRLGRLALSLYACLPYSSCHKKHLQHHCYPGTSRDPDFHDGVNVHAAVWYLRFMRSYLSMPQICGLAAAWIGTAALIAASSPSTPPTLALNIALFWMLPLVLSSVQLFLFGTYLPHRLGQAGEDGVHHVESLPLPAFLSLVSCYHFGFHLEHHQHPEAAWYELPGVHNGRWTHSATTHEQAE
jgi:beta-carotene/zeaxanthin 4-ketolase